MDMPRLPFDNLYKFLAILGMLICTLPTFYLSIEVDKLSVLVAELTAEIKYLETKGKATDTLEIRKKIAVLGAVNEQQRSKLGRIKTYLLLGIWISAYGLLSWYLKVQRLNDIILRNQTEQSKNVGS